MADLRRPAPVMPQPVRVTERVNLGTPTGPVSLDPSPVSAQTRISASKAWGTSSQRLPGSYRLLLGQYSSLFPMNRQHKSEIQNVLAWVIVGHHVPYIFDGGPALADATTVPPAPCQFADTLSAVDATTGRPIAGNAHSEGSP